MGEYAMFKGEEIKIGTCEDMYYLRFDQADLVQPLPGNVDPVRDAASLRFRFPFPHEDDVLPGHFENHNFGVSVTCELPGGFEHHNIQFRASAGLLVSLPCPDGPAALPNVHIAKNGYAGNVRIVQQRLVDDKLVLVCECGSCGGAFRLPTLDEALPVVDALRRRAERDGESATGFFAAISDRIVAGYTASYR